MTSPWHDTDVHIVTSITFHISAGTRLDPGVDSTTSEAKELENNETINVEFTRDLESDRDVTISVT